MKKLLQNLGKGVIAFVSATSFIFLFGCNKDKGNLEVFGPIYPNVSIEYVDKNGNPILQESELRQMYENGEKYFEVLSVTDDKGVSFGFGHFGNGSAWSPDILERFDVESPKMDRHYTLKFKAPRILGESVQELKLTFSVEGIDSKFTYASYNGEEIRHFVTADLFCPECLVNPHVFDLEDIQNRELVEGRIKALLYNGEANAYIEGFTIYLILPVERIK